MTLTRFVARLVGMLFIGGLIAWLPASVAAQAASEKPASTQLKIGTKLEQLRASLAELRRKGYSDRHPEVVRINADIVALENGRIAPPTPSQLQGFSVVLLLGDMQPGDSQDTVPVAARRALNDMKDFLPYKSYRLLDTQWVLCCSGGGSSAFTRLRGLDEQEFDLEVRGSFDLKANIHVHFVLRDPTPAAGPFKSATDSTAVQPKDVAKNDGDLASLSRERDLFEMERERVDLTTQVETTRSKVEVGMANHEDLKRMSDQLTMVNRRINQLKQSIQAGTPKVVGRAVIDSSFRMEEGETVVVGSSGVKGGKRALIALLTAVSSNKKAQSR